MNIALITGITGTGWFLFNRITIGKKLYCLGYNKTFFKYKYTKN